jgi:two-component system phosphate regulon sensor histidine kinase PhoR
VADVSHELRTPVSSIAAAAETLAETAADDPEAPRLVDLVRRQAQRMRELIDDLTDLSLIESGSVVLVPETVELRALAAETAEELRATAQSRDVSIRVESPEGIAVEGDRRIVVGQAENRPWVVVEDDGPGIPAAEQDRIFQRFYQVDRSRSKVRPGTGLGLAIVKHLAQLHGAEVTVSSEPGSGSAFRVTFRGAARTADAFRREP